MLAGSEAKAHKQAIECRLGEKEQFILIWQLSGENIMAEILMEQWNSRTANHQQLSDAVSFGFGNIPEGKGEKI